MAPQFVGDSRDDIAELGGLFRKESLAPGLLRDLLQSFPSLFRDRFGPVAEEALVRQRIRKSNAINLSISLLDLGQQLLEFVVTVAILTVCNHDNRFFGLRAVFGFLDAEVNRVIEGRAARDDDVVERVGNQIDVVGVVFQ